ncbi:hypothetical protein Plhal304r1_c001g0001551 [Plasmopara halstedii]
MLTTGRSLEEVLKRLSHIFARDPPRQVTPFSVILTTRPGKGLLKIIVRLHFSCP